MYRSLLVPLDRSSFAEQALPLALSIARRANARLDLVEVHDASWAPFDHQLDAECKRQEHAYLEATGQWLASASRVPITASVLSGMNTLAEMVADGILNRIRECRTDLIVLATHARGVLDRLSLGSIADELIRRAGVPVLVVPPRDTVPTLIPEPVVSDVLISLDGSPLAEQILDPAVELASLTEARCGLLQVVPPDSTGGQRAGNPPEVEKAEEYLNRVAARLRGQGVQVWTRILVARYAADAILEVIKAQPDSLIALATHGRGGLQRLLFGSVATRLIQAAPSPLLVYRPAPQR